jgi:hypothetical protein
LKEKWLCENTVISILDCVECFKHKLTRVCEIAQANLKQIQVKMKQLYDRDAPFFFQKRPSTECPKTSSKGLQRRDS